MRRKIFILVIAVSLVGALCQVSYANESVKSNAGTAESVCGKGQVAEVTETGFQCK